jgi:hypothetical protein
MGQLCSPDTIIEGPAPTFRPSPARSTLAASRALADPVRSGGSSRSLAVTSSYRLAAFLGRTGKMPRIRFYNRRSRHEHPLETPISETACRAPWETRRRSTSRPLLVLRLSPRRSSGAGPPRGHPTSDGHTLDGVPAGFGPVSYLFSHDLSRREPRAPLGARSARRCVLSCGRGSSWAFSAQGASADSTL